MSPATGAELKEVLAEVRRIKVQSNRLVTGVMAGNYLSVFRGTGIEFDEVREYAEGDDPRTLDWNVTARAGRPFVRKYVDERELTVLFLLDLSLSMTGGIGLWSARQAAARVAACLALSALKNHDKVGLVAFDREVVRYLPAKRQLGHVLCIVRDCLALEAPARPPGTGTDLKPALEFVSRVVRRRAIVFVLSDFLAAGYAQALALAARRHDVIAVRLLTPDHEPPAAGLWRAVDPESGRVRLLDFRSRAVAARFRREMQAFRSSTEAALLKARVDRVDVPVPRRPSAGGRETVARPLLEFFRMRELRGTKA